MLPKKLLDFPPIMHTLKELQSQYQSTSYGILEGTECQQGELEAP